MIRIRKKDGSIDRAELTFAELIIAVVILGLIGQICLFIIPIEYVHTFILSLSVGWWIGIGAAVFMATHLYNNVSDIVMMAEKDADDVLRHNMIIRYGIIFVVMVLIYLTKLVNPVAYVVGVIMLKPAVYLQPLVDKIYTGIAGRSGKGVD